LLLPLACSHATHRLYSFPFVFASNQTIKSSPVSIPLFHFSAVSPHEALWDSHPTFSQFKSILLDFFRGVEMDAVALKGLERVISVTIGGEALSPAADQQTTDAVNGKGKAAAVDSLISGGAASARHGAQDYDEDKALPVVHFRTYSVVMKRSGTPTPLIELVPHGPHFTFSLRRSQLPSVEVWKQAMKKTEKKKLSEGAKPKNKNIDVSAFDRMQQSTLRLSLLFAITNTDSPLFLPHLPHLLFSALLSLLLDRRDGGQGWSCLRRFSRLVSAPSAQVQRTQGQQQARRCRGRGREAVVGWGRRRSQANKNQGS
jgi:hypothetical protein